MIEYKQFKDKICLPVTYSKMTIIYTLAFATKANPKWKSDKRYVRFTAGKENTIFLLITPILIYVLFMVGFIIQIAGVYRFIWIWPIIYFAYSFDYIWLNKEEALLLSNSIEKITTEKEEKEDDTNTGE